LWDAGLTVLRQGRQQLQPQQLRRRLPWLPELPLSRAAAATGVFIRLQKRHVATNLAGNRTCLNDINI